MRITNTTLEERYREKYLIARKALTVISKADMNPNTARAAGIALGALEKIKRVR